MKCNDNHINPWNYHTESQYEKFKADKEEEQLDLQRNYKRQLINAEDKMR